MRSAPTEGSATLRTSLIALAAITTIGVGVELAIERHWGTNPARYIPWLCLVALGWSAYALARRPTVRAIRAVRVIGGAVIVAAIVGVSLHINENYSAGPLDQRYESLWAGMSEPARWWSAFVKTVGPAPTFAPMALAETALLLLIATRRHPALIGGTA